MAANLQRDAAREISYSRSAQTVWGRRFIQAVENSSGRIGLIRRADGYESEVSAGRDFWQVMVDRYGLSIDLMAGGLERIPQKGPLVLVANHPFGILDGLIVGHILSQVRKDFRILANNVFQKAEELNRVVLPISFDETRSAQMQNIKTRKVALEYLAQGGAIGVFPGGTVSTSLRPFSVPMDPRWRSFTAKMVVKSGVRVVPLYFQGNNSRLFQLASHLSPTLRLSLLIREFGRRVDTPVRIAVGDPIPAEEIERRGDNPRDLMEFLRQSTYALSPVPLRSYAHGYEFEEKHKD